jgi:hypothetical protein
MAAKISASEFGLLLRGWSESKRRVRVVPRSSIVFFDVVGTVHSAREDGSFSIAIDVSSMIGVSIAIGTIWAGTSAFTAAGRGVPLVGLGRKKRSPGGPGRKNRESPARWKSRRWSVSSEGRRSRQAGTHTTRIHLRREIPTDGQ